MENTVYVCRVLDIAVNEPEYVIGVFSSIENAKKALRCLQEQENLRTLVSGIDYEIEEYTINNYRWCV
jgi:anti-sigma-K factor RskA